MRALVTSILVVVAGGTCGLGQDVEKTPEERTPAQTNLLSEPVVQPQPQTLSTLKQTGLTYDQVTASEVLLPDLEVSTNAPLQAVPTNTLTTIELERFEVHGTLTPVIKKRTFGSFLQLFNPFAPAEYGGSGTPAGRDSFNPVTDGPTTVLIGVGVKPKPADTE